MTPKSRTARQHMLQPISVATDDDVSTSCTTHELLCVDCRRPQGIESLCVASLLVDDAETSIHTTTVCPMHSTPVAYASSYLRMAACASASLFRPYSSRQPMFHDASRLASEILYGPRLSVCCVERIPRATGDSLNTSLKGCGVLQMRHT